MRTTNNTEQRAQSNDDTETQHYWVIYDTDTCEHLVDWSEYAPDLGGGGDDVWANLGLLGGGSETPDDVAALESGELCLTFGSKEEAFEVLVSVGAELSSRFPDETINLVVQKITVRTRVELEMDIVADSEVQSFGDEEVEEEEAPPPSAKRKASKKSN